MYNQQLSFWKKINSIQEDMDMKIWIIPQLIALFLAFISIVSYRRKVERNSHYLPMDWQDQLGMCGSFIFWALVISLIIEVVTRLFHG